MLLKFWLYSCGFLRPRCIFLCLEFMIYIGRTALIKKGIFLWSRVLIYSKNITEILATVSYLLIQYSQYGEDDIEKCFKVSIIGNDRLFRSDIGLNAREKVLSERAMMTVWSRRVICMSTHYWDELVRVVTAKWIICHIRFEPRRSDAVFMPSILLTWSIGYTYVFRHRRWFVYDNIGQGN